MNKMQKYTHIIAIDPAYAKPCAFGVANIDQELIVDFGLSDPENIYSEIKPFNYEKPLVVIEQMHYRVNPKIFQQLSEVVAVLAYEAKSAGLDVIRLAPKTWQTAFRKPPRAKSKELKDASKFWARQEVSKMDKFRTARVETLKNLINEDIADAINMAMFQARAEKWQVKAGVKPVKGGQNS
jgi:Holliday junction resolvasome RuvABC endonuclease subunit